MRLISNTLLSAVLAVPMSVYAVPDWFSESDINPEVAIGTGIGEDLNMAKQDALTNLSISLYSEVSSYSEHSVSTKGNKGEIDSQATTKVENQQIPLTLIKWTKQQYDNGLFYVRGDMNIAEWVHVQETKLEAKINEIEGITSLKNWSLSDYRRSQSITLHQPQVIAEMISPYSMASSRFNLARVSLVEKQNQFANSVCFSVASSHDKIADKYFKPVIESALHHSRLKVSDQNNCRKVKFIARNDKVSSSAISTKLLVNIDGESSYQIEVEGSGVSYKSALVSVANNLNDFFVQQGGILPSAD